MELNKIKIALYKEKPLAIIIKVTKSSITYRTTIKADGSEDISIYFDVPLSEIGDAVFERFMDAKLLIRWIIVPEEDPRDNPLIGDDSWVDDIEMGAR
jgi:hypothetical protein